MAEIKVTFPFSIQNVAITPKKVIENYLVGLPVNLGENGFTESAIVFYVRQAMLEIETLFNIKIFEQEIYQEIDFNRNEFMSCGLVKTDYPINDAISLEFRFGANITILRFHESWLKENKNNTNGVPYRKIHVMPQYPYALAYTGVPFSPGWFVNTLPYNGIPDYLQFKYKTGWKCCPEDLQNLIGMMAAVQMLHHLSNVVIAPGITFQLAGIDGLSNSLSVGEFAYKASINNLNGRIRDLRAILERKYKGYPLNVI